MPENLPRQDKRFIRVSQQKGRSFMRILSWVAGLSLGYVLSHLTFDFLTRGDFADSAVGRNGELASQLAQSKAHFGPVRFNVFVRPEPLADALGEAYHHVTGNDLNSNLEYRSLIIAIALKETGFRTHKKMCSWLPFPEVGGTSRGMMQNKLIDRGADPKDLVSAMKSLDQIVLVYAADRELDERIVRCVLADWCAGRSSSLVANLQSQLNVSSRSGKPLDLDGDIGSATALVLEHAGAVVDARTRAALQENIGSLHRPSLDAAANAKSHLLGLLSLNKSFDLTALRRSSVIADAEVRGAARRLTQYLSGPSGWLSSREFADETILLYRQIRSLGRGEREAGLRPRTTAR